MDAQAVDFHPADAVVYAVVVKVVGSVGGMVVVDLLDEKEGEDVCRS